MANLSHIDGFIYRIEYDFISQIIAYYFRDRDRIDVMEIGSYKGKSTVMFLEAHPQTFITCIEPFCGPTDADVQHLYGSQFKEDFLKNTERYRDRVRLIEKYSSDPSLRDDLRGATFDICFIDGDHTFSSVVNDIELCLPLLKKGGLLILDDYWIDCDPSFKFRGVRDAVNKMLLYQYKFLFVVRSMIIFQHDVQYKSYER